MLKIKKEERRIKKFLLNHNVPGKAGVEMGKGDHKKGKFT